MFLLCTIDMRFEPSLFHSSGLVRGGKYFFLLFPLKMSEGSAKVGAQLNEVSQGMSQKLWAITKLQGCHEVF